MDINHVFANRRNKKEIYPKTVNEIAEAQKNDRSLQQLKVSSKYKTMHIENTNMLCKDGKLVLFKKLQHIAVAWYHHYLQNPGHKHL